MSETKYLTCAETAKLVRETMKVEFPGQKFSVRSSTYAGGASIRIGWTDGPTAAQVQSVTKIFEGSTFDGMIDFIQGYIDDEGMMKATGQNLEDLQESKKKYQSLAD